jgi:hypothetical protein
MMALAPMAMASASFALDLQQEETQSFDNRTECIHVVVVGGLGPHGNGVQMASASFALDLHYRTRTHSRDDTLCHMCCHKPCDNLSCDRTA